MLIRKCRRLIAHRDHLDSRDESQMISRFSKARTREIDARLNYQRRMKVQYVTNILSAARSIACRQISASAASPRSLSSYPPHC